tara:strand:+ start:174 stop:1580 length:1407 start_codon:yes stop_codon:yes gene_type:complete
MSSKDIRFIMPLYPIICIYFSLIFNHINHKLNGINVKKYIMIFSLTFCIVLTIKNDSITKTTKSKNFLDVWPHYEIIKEIEVSNPGIFSVLAVIPDTKEINTFNLEAEAIRRGKKVAVRQVVSNLNTYRKDLEYFDWFLIKSKNQGIMTNKAKKSLQKLIEYSPHFIVQKEWELPDKSNLYLYKRKILSTSLRENECNAKSPSAEITQISNGLNIKLMGEGKEIAESLLLLDFHDKERKSGENISLGLPLFKANLQNKTCYEISHNTPVDLKYDKRRFYTKLRLLESNGNKRSINLKNRVLTPETELTFEQQNNILMANKINDVKKLGRYLKDGEFEKLFNLVGVLNQSDPSQIYLADSERIYMQRFKETGNLDDLYNILISQILQRKIKNSKNTIENIVSIDNNNGNAFLTKAVINIYLIKPSDALKAIKKAKKMPQSIESIKITKTVEGIAKILNFNFIEGLQNFS